MKKLFDEKDLKLAKSISGLAYCNPFLPERIDYEREILGANFDEKEAAWNTQAGHFGDRLNLDKIVALIDNFVSKIQRRFQAGTKGSAKETGLYKDAALFFIYHKYHENFQGLIETNGVTSSHSGRPDFFAEFRREYKRFLDIPGIQSKEGSEAAHFFACFFQVRRAFHHIFSYIIGGSSASAKLRASVWQSIFTHDMKRYQNNLYRIMGDMTTLITGPSGTGKELVSRAIGMSRYIPFNENSGRFEGDFKQTFLPLNISSLSPTLVESELFGHKKGAFTGALQDRAGWLETCSPLGTVFLDEVGEIDAAIQVKLLRVLQERTFQRLGDTKELKFRGKIIAATNRDLAEEMEKGSFRSDFYYRLCSDIVSTPSLHEQLCESPEELNILVSFITARMVGDEAPRLACEGVKWIEKNLGPDYKWPGNIRELEQCIRNVMIRNEYHPPVQEESSDTKSTFTEEILAGSLTADELLTKYCTLVYSQTGSYQETARRLGLDRRTVKAKID